MQCVSQWCCCCATSDNKVAYKMITYVLPPHRQVHRAEVVGPECNLQAPTG